MKTNTKRFLLILASALPAIVGTSCGTVSGFGHDVEEVGDRIQKAGN
jgi:predicted small secreted protein